MQHYVDKKDVQNIAKTARILLDEEGLSKMTEDLNSIIETLQPIRQYDLDGVEPIFHPIGGMHNIVREDEVKSGLSKQDALLNAPKEEDGCFVVPSILGNGEA